VHLFRSLYSYARLSRDGFDLSNRVNWPHALFAVGKHRYHVQSEQRDQNAECNVIGNCHDGGTFSFVRPNPNFAAKPEIAY
jgi:hypothetical protein